MRVRKSAPEIRNKGDSQANYPEMAPRITACYGLGLCTDLLTIREEGGTCNYLPVLNLTLPNADFVFHFK